MTIEEEAIELLRTAPVLLPEGHSPSSVRAIAAANPEMGAYLVLLRDWAPKVKALLNRVDGKE